MVALYRRFRPGRFEELRGQPHVVLALRSAVRDDKVSHAYLFSGPRGTGKTSTAWILAKALNCAAPLQGEPCGECPSCLEIAKGTSLDVHEMDAASNNGVDAIRDLIAHAALGTPGRWKVYIVDEVHMLSTAAANVLLKTLEEPPSHVIFVLATTDPQKVQATIRSRTQHFEFRLLGADVLSGLVAEINDAAGLTLDPEALAAAVRRGRGSARDALSALDQVAASGSADGVRPGLEEIITAFREEDATRALVAVAELHEAGWGPQQLATELVEELRQRFLAIMAPELADERAKAEKPDARIALPRLVRCIELLGRAQVEMRDAPDPRVVLEVALARLTRPELDDSGAALADRMGRLERQVATGGTGSGAPSTVRTTADAPVGPPPDPATRPSIGALRRARQQEPPTPTPTAAEVPGSIPRPAPAPAQSDPVAAPNSAATTEARPAGPPERDELVQAWGDHILRGLPARAKAIFSAGRWVAADAFALPNEAHRSRCEETLPIVAEALAAYFGEAVPIRLVVEEGKGVAADPGNEGAEEMAPAGGAPSTTESEAEARVLEAFPGTQEVEV